MLPGQFNGTPLNSLTLNGSPVSYTLQTIKGMQYAVFAASANGTYSAQYNAVTSVTVNPSSVIGGDPATGTVTINSPALSGGVVVTLQSGNPAAAIPTSVTIAQGQTSAPFNVSTSQVLSTTPVYITASFNSTSQSATLTLMSQLMTLTTTVALTAGANPSIYGSSLTFTATVSGAGPTPTGSVSFYDGGLCSAPGATLGSAVALNGSAQASITTSVLTAATTPHTILACYPGDANYTTSSGTIAQTVNSATNPSLIPQTGWSLLSVDSQETTCYNGAATNAFDGNPATLWHTQFCGGAPPTPHQISINLGASYTLNGFQYLPRQDGSACGWIKDYAFYVSTDGVNWGTAVATGTFNYGSLSTQCPGPGAGVPAALQIVFPPATGHYVRLRALSEINGNPWTSAAEIDVLGALASGQSAALASVSLNPATVAGGGASTGTVMLSIPAPAGGAVVSLTSSNTAVATVPASVTVPANAVSATFAITTTAVSAVTQLNISGSYNGNAQATLTVTPGLIPQTGWSLLSVDSQETSCYNGAATNAFDGNPATLWHTQFCGGAPPTPHQISINLGASYTLSGFQYLPRQDGSACGWIKDYAFYISTDGVNWGTAVATGTFNYGSLSTNCPGPGAGVPPALQVTFPATTGQYIRLVGLDELHGNPWTSAAEIDVLGSLASGQSAALASVSLNPATVAGGGASTGTVMLSIPAPAGGAVVSLTSSNTAVATVPASVTVPANAVSATFTVNSSAVSSTTQVNISGSYNGSAQATLTVTPGLIPQTGWSLLSVDSQETTCYNGAATNAFDGNPATLWHTQFCGGAPPTPHQISINLGASYTLSGFQYLPRQDGSACGWIKDYAFYISTDGVNWGTAVATGTFNYGSLSTNCPGPGAGVPPALQVTFPATTGQYIQLVALDELHGNPWTSAAEIDVLGTASGAPSNTPPPTLAQVTVNPAIVVGGTSAQGTVTLSGPAPAGGAVVSLSSSNPAATVPATVTVPANGLSAIFTITTTAVSAVTELNISGSYNGSAQATLTVAPGSIPQTGWSLLSVDSQETTCYNGAATNAFDGNPATLWHTQFCGGAPPTPHQISINLGASYTLSGFQYLPRQDGSACGWIKDYAFYISTDGVNWGTAVATGTFNYGSLSTNCPGPGAGVPRHCRSCSQPPPDNTFAWWGSTNCTAIPGPRRPRSTCWASRFPGSQTCGRIPAASMGRTC